jgi:hypothetical protein
VLEHGWAGPLKPIGGKLLGLNNETPPDGIAVHVTQYFHEFLIGKNNAP